MADIATEAANNADPVLPPRSRILPSATFKANSATPLENAHPDVRVGTRIAPAMPLPVSCTSRRPSTARTPKSARIRKTCRSVAERGRTFPHDFSSSSVGPPPGQNLSQTLPPGHQAPRFLFGQPPRRRRPSRRVYVSPPSTAPPLSHSDESRKQIKLGDKSYSFVFILAQVPETYTQPRFFTSF